MIQHKFCVDCISEEKHTCLGCEMVNGLPTKMRTKDKPVEKPVTIDGKEVPATRKAKFTDTYGGCPCIGCLDDSSTDYCNAWKPYWKCPKYSKWLKAWISTFPEERQVLRNSMVLYLEDIGVKTFMITCDTCRDSGDCEWSYDPYNTDGDCLGAK